jgi:hypothetical protein
MGIEIEEMTVDVDDTRPEGAPTVATPTLPVDVLLRQVLAAIADEEARRQRLIAD